MSGPADELLRSTGAIRMAAAAMRVIHEIRMRESVSTKSPEWAFLTEAFNRVSAIEVCAVANKDIGVL